MRFKVNKGKQQPFPGGPGASQKKRSWVVERRGGVVFAELGYTETTKKPWP